MKTLFVLEDRPYVAERSYKALRLAGALAKRDTHELRVVSWATRLHAPW